MCNYDKGVMWGAGMTLILVLVVAFALWVTDTRPEVVTEITPVEYDHTHDHQHDEIHVHTPERESTKARKVEQCIDMIDNYVSTKVNYMKLGMDYQRPYDGGLRNCFENMMEAK